MKIRSRPLLASLIFLSSACHRAPSSISLTSSEARVDVALSPFSLTLRSPDGRALLGTAAEGTLAGPYGAPGATEDRPTFTGQALAGWDGYQAHELGWLRGASARLLDRDARSARLQLAGPGVALVIFVSLDGARARVELSTDAPALNKIGLSFALPADESFHGLGERFATFNHRGQSLYSWAEEGGLGAGEDAPPAAQNPYPNGPSMTWFPVPFLLSNRGYAVFADTTARLEWHLGDERTDAWRVAANAQRIALTVYVHDAPLDSIRDYTQDTGRPAPPSPWTFGPRRSSGVYNTSGGLPEWQRLRAEKVPTTAIDDNVHFLPARSELGREDQLRAYAAQLHAAGFKLLGYFTPYISQSKASGAADLAYGTAHDLFVKDASGNILSTFFSSGEPQNLATIDLSNPDGTAWFQSILGRALALGYDGWMHDFGEYLPREALLADGRTGAQAHNDFSRLSARAAFELLEREKPNDYLFFVRSGTAGSQAVAPAVWSGDPEASFDETTGLPANLRAGLSLSMSGMPYWGSDIGGYKCLTSAPHDKEMYLRWAEVGAVSPLMMDDTACFTLSGTAQKWTLWSDAETIAIYGQHARFHTRLQPYFLTLVREASASGRPLMMHPSLLFPGEPQAWLGDDAFFLGPAIFAAPVVRRGVTTREVWLPPGRYVDLDDLRVYAGGARVSIPAPLAKLPLLLREGQLLPLLDPSIETLAPATDGTIDPAQVADRLDVQVALAAGQSARLTLIDGTELTAERLPQPQSSEIPIAPATPDTIAACSLCELRSTEGDVDRLRLNGALAADAEVWFDDLHVTARGGPARRVHWDVLRLRQ
jgi:alpha-glucosidase (family GH31 glycosyl hydrolase)